MEAMLLEAVRDGIVNHGNWFKVKRCLERAAAGEPVTVGFIGGSITQDAGTSRHENCYAYHVYQWWRKTFPQTKISYVNAGIGATTSHFGVARVQSDLLYAKPDFVVVEFSVNDNDIDGIDETEFFRETYEGLIRRIYGADCQPAVLLVHNVRYHDGSSAEDIHAEIGRAYDLPCVSMRKTVYPYVRDGVVAAANISGDNLHPNDLGHKILAGLITSFLERVMEADETEVRLCPKKAAGKAEMPELREAITENSYENATRLQNGTGCFASANWKADGFAADDTEQETIRDIFKGGWTAEQVGASIVFEVTGRNIAVQYRKSVKQPTPIAKVTVDDCEEKSVLLDGNFEQDWGDKLQLDKVVHHGTGGKHKVEVRIVQADQPVQAPFYLTSLIVAG